ASFRRDPAHRLWPVVVVAFHDVDQACLLEHGEVATEIAVGERTHLLQVAEGETLGMGDERGQHAETRLLVDDAIEPVIGEAAAAFGLAISFRHLALRCCGKARRPYKAARPRTARPSRTAKTRSRRWRGRGSRARPRDTRPRPRTS